MIAAALRRLTALAFLLAALPLHGQEQEPPRAADIDWTPLQQLTPQQRAAVEPGCCGRYIEPEFPPPDANGGVVVTADRGNLSRSDENSAVLALEGAIDIVSEQAWLQADSALIDNAGGTIELNDGVRIRRPGMLLVAEGATINQGESGQLREASYVFHEQGGRGAAEVIAYTDADGIVTIDNGYFSRCEPGSNAWLLRGATIELDPGAGRATARNVTFRIGNVPVLYTPYLSFSIDNERSSGILLPDIGYTRDGGLDVGVPYYFNLAPNYDATLTPRLITRRGLMLDLEARHLGRDSRNTLNLSYLGEDDLFRPGAAYRPGSDSPPRETRWQLAWEADARFSDNLDATVNYTAVSDTEYLQDFNSTGLTDTSRYFLGRRMDLNYHHPNWDVSATLQGYQMIDPTIPETAKPFATLPRVNVGGMFPAGGGLRYGIAGEYAYFHRGVNEQFLTPADIAAGALVTGQRLALEPVLSWSRTTPGSFIRPTLKYKYAAWSLDDQAAGSPARPERGVFTGSIDGGLVFERDAGFGGEALTQTLEPRLYYLYSEYEDQSAIPLFDTSDLTFGFNQLFREDRFSGKDRVGDANQLTLALSSRFLDASGRERARIAVGQTLYFEDRRVTLGGAMPDRSRSSLAAEGSWRFSDDWRVSAYQEWDTDAGKVNAGSFQFQYQSDINHIINAGYRYRELPRGNETIDQTDFSVVWPLATGWGLVGRWNYDHSNSRNLESIIGVEYSDCCWSMRLVARQWIDTAELILGNEEDNRGIFLQFELKGLGSVLGGNVTDMLGESIIGYRADEYSR